MTTLLLTLALAAPAPKEPEKPAPPGDHPLLGDWVVESHVSSGKPIRPVRKPERITVTRDRWIIKTEAITESCLTVDAVKSHVDIWVPTQGDEDPNRCTGIYKIEGGTLTICYRLDGVRPAKFTSLPKSGDYLITLKRRQKE